jgi:hypothetical protein
MTIELLGLLTLVARRADDGETQDPGPSELGALCPLDEVLRRRSLWCPAYDRCLDTACRRGWRSWTCEQCTLFLETGPSCQPAAANAASVRLPPSRSNGESSPARQPAFTGLGRTDSRQGAPLGAAPRIAGRAWRSGAREQGLPRP